MIIWNRNQEGTLKMATGHGSRNGTCKPRPGPNAESASAVLVQSLA
jgi:hypothetical protein